MATKFGSIRTSNTILFIANSGNITNTIATDFASYGNDFGISNATEAQKQVYIYNRVIADAKGFGTTTSGLAMLPVINKAITTAIIQAMVAVSANVSMQDDDGNNILTKALSHDALRELLGLAVITTNTPDARAAIVAIASHPNLTDVELPQLTIAIQSCINNLDFEQYATILAIPAIHTNTANARALIHKFGCIKPLTCDLCGKGC